MAEKPVQKIRVLLVDDHPLVREGIRIALSSSKRIEVVAEAANGNDALQQAERAQPDLVLLDITIPQIGGIEVARRIQRTRPEIKILILSMHEEREVIREAVAAGVRGYVLKDSTPQVLIEAIESVFRGETYFSPVVSQTLVADYVAQSARVTVKGREDILSPREVEVLALLAQGLTNREISGKLFISIRTVETHRERIREKLGIKTAAGLARYAIAQGIIGEK